ncbi:hypothetical protein DUNSADRAFT_1243 [Dunaliella salina]|uniref:G-patch domain-containing protein n=1 Tax=Dunaliella salina TaxID=3046 RepID=A0ABQ7FXR8_DUNSA|nr:hypothetical protein DUNSADRAFT_1243 [Dunaliella salina]|eukprot:KAF5827152.1 hypothetical protein DUNSADRAFT_1243 [Dunaliella salina]
MARDGPGGYMEQRLKEPVRFVSAGVQDPKQQLDQLVHEAQQQQQQQQQQHVQQAVPLHPPRQPPSLEQGAGRHQSSASADPVVLAQPTLDLQGNGEQAVHAGPHWMGGYWGGGPAAAAAAGATAGAAGDAGAYAQWYGGMPSWGEEAGGWPSGWDQWHAYYGYGSSMGMNGPAAGPHLELGWVNNEGGTGGRRSDADEGHSDDDEQDAEQGWCPQELPHGVCVPPPPSVCFQPDLHAPHDPTSSSSQQQQQPLRSSSPSLPPAPPKSSLPSASLPPHLQHQHQPPSSLPLPPPPPLPASSSWPSAPGSMPAEGSPTPEPDGAPIDTRTRNARKMARKKANKRAREQGLPPPKITPPPGGPSHHPPQQKGAPGAGPAQQGGAGAGANQGAEPNSKKARKAAAEAVLNRFAGFEEHTSGIGSKLLGKMGWKSGDGLGQKAQGIYEPVLPKIVTGKRGLGAN